MFSFLTGWNVYNTDNIFRCFEHAILFLQFRIRSHDGLMILEPYLVECIYQRL